MSDVNEIKLVGKIKYKPAGIGLKLETTKSNGTKEFITTHEILFFDKAHLPFNEGDVVTVTGELGSKKSEYEREHNGKKYPVYMTQIIGRTIERTVGADDGEEMP